MEWTQILTTENWVNIMYSTITATSMWAVIYFVTLIVSGICTSASLTRCSFCIVPSFPEQICAVCDMCQMQT